MPTKKLKNIKIGKTFFLENVKKITKNGITSFKATIYNDVEFWGEMNVFAKNKQELKELTIKRLRFQGDL